MWGIQDRRHFMKHMIGASAVTVPGMSFLANLHAQAPALKKKNKSIIILWMGGGPTTIDLWDMKPGHPNGGEHRPKPTAASGVSISEHLPNLAKQFKNLAIIRSLTTSEGDHARGTSLMHTSRTPNPLVDYPSLGATLAYQEQVNGYEPALPAFVSINGGGGGAGFLGMRFAPFTVQNPGQPPENIRPADGVSEDRMLRRKGLFDRFESGFQASTKMPNDAAKAHLDVYGKAMDLVVSKNKDVFSIAKEPMTLQEEYGAAGTGANNFGRGLLLARKLVEAGAVAVEVSLGGWDMHNGIFNALATRALPQLDKAFAALTRDLKDRGLLQNTAIVWMGEFGRTPRINQNGGRDHYPRAWSVVVGGGSIKGGQAYGETDAGGESVKDKPVKVGDLFATLYKAVGLDPETQVRDNLGRPMPIAEGKPIADLVG